MNRNSLEQKISTTKKIPFFERDIFYKDFLSNIEKSFEKKPFKIAVVGEFSTGKSTFINALLGRDLLLHATEETTATITNIYNVARSNPKWHSCDVVFSDEKIEHLKDDSKLLDYTTTKSRTTDVVNAIKSVDYYTDFMDETIDAVIVDTPGLNGMADKHRELTISEVKQSDFCIYLTGIRGLAESDKIILQELSYYQKNFVFIINFVDQLKVSENETVEEKIAEISRILDNEIFTGKDIKYQVFGVSALKALASKDRTIKKLYQGDEVDIKEDDRERYYEESRISTVENYIRENINNSTVDRLCVERVRHMLLNMLDSSIDDLEQRQKRIEYLRESSGANKTVDFMEGKLNFFVESSKKNKEKVIIYAKSECGSIRRELMDYVREELQNINDKYTNHLMVFKKYEELEEYIESNQLDSSVRTDADKLYDYVEDNMLICLNDVLNNILVRIQKYLKDTQIDANEQIIDFEVKGGIKRSGSDFSSAESSLQDAKRAEIEARRKADEIQSKQDKEQEKQDNAKKRLMQDEQQLQRAQNAKEQRLRSIGSQPAVESRTEYSTEYYTDYEYRGGLGILDSIFGPKSVRKSRQVPHTYKDDTKRKEWVKNRDRILADSNREIDQYQRQVNDDKNQISNSEKMLRQLKLDARQAKEGLEFWNNKYETDKKTLENLKKKANQELLNTLRKSIIQQLNQYCDFEQGNIAGAIKSYISETIDENLKIICQKTGEYYESRVDSLVQSYRNEIDGKVSANNDKYGDYAELLKQIKELREELQNAE